MKDFILSVGDWTISASAVLALILMIVIGAYLIYSKALVAGLSVLLLGPGLLVETFYFFYSVIDIRDQLKKISENTNK